MMSIIDAGKVELLQRLISLKLRISDAVLVDVFEDLAKKVRGW